MKRNSTIITKKRKLDCGCFDYAFSKNRCKAHATIESTKKRIIEHEQVEDVESMQNLVDDLDVLISRYVRLKYMDEKTRLIQCYTCPSKLPLAKMTNGHYVARGNMILRFDTEWNCRPQCPLCNSNHENDDQPFTLALERENKGITDYLKSKGREVYKFTLDELKQLISETRFKVKILEKQKLKK